MRVGPSNQFHRDLRVLLLIGLGTAGAIAAVGALALRGVRWEESSGLLEELGVYTVAGGVVLAAIALWAWRVARRLRRQPPPAGKV